VNGDDAVAGPMTRADAAASLLRCVVVKTASVAIP
jgi:hypothetical protein